MTDWLAPILFCAAAAFGYVVGHRRGGAPWREEQRQREIEARLLGRDTLRKRSTAPPAVVRSARIVSTKAWRR